MHFKSSWLKKLADFVTTYPRHIFIVSVVSALLSGLYALNFLQIDTNEDHLISQKKDYQINYQSFLDEFGDWETFFVVFEVPEGKSERAKDALKSLVQSLEGHPDFFKEIIDREDLSLFESRGLLILPSKEFKHVLEKLPTFAPLIQSASSWDSLIPVFEEINRKLSASTSELKKQGEDLKAGFEFIKKLLQGLKNPSVLDTLSTEDLFMPLLGKRYHQDEEGYFFSRSGKLLYLRVMPVKDFSTMKVVEAPLNFIREKIAVAQRQFPDIPIGLTGRPVLSADQMDSTGVDSVIAFLASLAGVGLLYILYLRRFKRPLIIMTCLIIGMLWSIGFITLTVGHLNLLTLVFTIILVGIGVDYGMHLLIRAMKEEEAGQPQPVWSSIIKSGEGIVTGAISTIAAFLTALAADFLGLQELGFVSGMGVFFCLIAMIVTLPAALTLWDFKDRHRESSYAGRNDPVSGLLRSTFGRSRKDILNYAPIILILILLATICSIPALRHVRFENNLLKLQDDSLESVRYEQKILEDSGLSAWFAAMIAKSPEELFQLTQKVEALESVDETESILSLVPYDQEERIRKLKSLSEAWGLKDSLPLSASTVDLPTLSANLSQLQESLEKLQSLAFEAGETEAVEEIDALVNLTAAAKKNISMEALQAQNKFLAFIQKNLTLLKANLNPLPLTEDKLPETLYKRYKSSQGSYALYIYPRQNIWDPAFMEKFVSELRSVDPHVTGAPIGVYESGMRMKQGFYRVAFLTLILVIIFLLLDFRSIKDTFVSLIPLFAGLTWLGAWMSWLDIPLSLGNFFSLPILIGLGIDNGVHLMHGYHETGSVEKMLKTVGPAVILSTLTTLIGFGALSFIHHKGLASFGQIMSLGSMTCLAASFVLVPLILKIFYKKT